MSIYHCSVKIGSRSKGQSAIAASAYRSGTKMTDAETGTVSDFTRKGGIVYSEVALCDNAPSDYANREILWNAVHKIEKNQNSRLWREVEVALPQELEREKQIETVREYVRGFTDMGMCADWSLHDKGDGNPHAHIMLTTRPIEPNGEWVKLKEKKEYALDENGERIPIIDEKTGLQKLDSRNRKQWKRVTVIANEWNNRENVELWRAQWAECCNKRLSEQSHIDHRSYERQGVDKIPTIHEGYVARAMEQRGELSDRCEINRDIRKQNSILVQIAQQIKAIGEKIKAVMLEIQKGDVRSERVRALLARRNGGAADGMRTAADGDRKPNLGEQPLEETDRRIADLKRNEEQQRLADELRAREEQERRAAEEAERERKYQEWLDRNSGAR